MLEKVSAHQQICQEIRIPIIFTHCCRLPRQLFCSKLTKETQEQGVKYAQSQQ